MKMNENKQTSNIKVGMVSLGCSKNQVDGERMLAALRQAGFILESDPALCQVVLINTCGFIEAAKTESIDTILEFAQLKKTGTLKVIAVTGCLAQRYQEEMQENLPEIDVLLGIGSNEDIVAAIQKGLAGEKVAQFGSRESLSLEGPRVLANQPYFAYLKVAEGCDNRCTYCAIPSIRGAFRSRPMENIVAEAKELAAMGVKELNVVAQDTTRYGDDLYGRLMLPELLKELCLISGIQWIRLLYCYPERVTPELIQVMKEEPKIVKYLDLPLQHASNTLLKRMNRKGTVEEVTALLQNIRKEIPEIALRTTFITGFPGETEEDFEALCDFVSAMKFQRLGCFAYSREEGTPAATFKDQIPEDVKQRRAETIMDIQLGIMDNFHASLLGQEVVVLSEGFNEELGCEVGRSYRDAPDVDSHILFSRPSPKAGDFVQVVLEESKDLDLVGRVVE